MSRYIDADELKRSLWTKILEEEVPKGEIGEYILEDFIEMVAGFPTADVAEVKHGQWIVDREFGNDVMSDEQMVICSECGKGIFWGKQNYCPNCGAKMDEVHNENPEP